MILKSYHTEFKKQFIKHNFCLKLNSQVKKKNVVGRQENINVEGHLLKHMATLYLSISFDSSS